MDGPSQIDRSTGLSASETGSVAIRRTQIGQTGYEFQPKLGRITRKLNGRNSVCHVTRWLVGFSEHPKINPRQFSLVEKIDLVLNWQDITYDVVETTNYISVDYGLYKKFELMINLKKSILNVMILAKIGLV